MKYSLSILFIFLAFYNCNAQTEFGEMSIKVKDSKDSILTNLTINCNLIDTSNQNPINDIKLTVSNGKKILFDGKTDSLGAIVFNLDSNYNYENDKLSFTFNNSEFKRKYPSGFITENLKIILSPKLNIQYELIIVTSLGTKVTTTTSDETPNINENGETFKREDIKHMPSRN